MLTTGGADRMNPTGWRLPVALAGVLVLTFVVHEAAHWAMGVALGHEMVVGLNGAGTRAGGASARDAFLISAAGPFVTIVQALAAFQWLRSRASTLAYAMLFAACFMRFAAAVVSVAHPNDEARLSLALDLGTWTVPALVVGGLFALTWAGSRRLGIGWRMNVALYLAASVAVAALVALAA
jgi:hypothetical protein